MQIANCSEFRNDTPMIRSFSSFFNLQFLVFNLQFSPPKRAFSTDN